MSQSLMEKYHFILCNLRFLESHMNIFNSFEFSFQSDTLLKKNKKKKTKQIKEQLKNIPELCSNYRTKVLSQMSHVDGLDIKSLTSQVSSTKSSWCATVNTEKVNCWVVALLMSACPGFSGSSSSITSGLFPVVRTPLLCWKLLTMSSQHFLEFVSEKGFSYHPFGIFSVHFTPFDVPVTQAQ